MTKEAEARELLKSLSSLNADFSSLEDGDVKDLQTEEFKRIRQKFRDERARNILISPHS